MMKSRQILLFLLVSASMALNGQYTKEFKRIFFDAEYLYQTGFYEEAFNRYKNLLTLDPGNNNILFHCGACCLNIPGSEAQAITYLKEAVTGVTQDYKERSHKEPGAPVITFYMLGRAYHLHNEFEKAVENYSLYEDMGVDEDPLQLEYAGLQIEACSRAAKVVGSSPSFEFQSVLDHFDDDLPSCNNPVISGDGNILIFLVDYPSDKKIMMTTRSEGLWSRPRVINSEIGMVGETYPVCLSYDGKDLYLVHQFYSHSDIFVSRFGGGRWSEAEALGANVNGRTSESHASISKDGNTLYFTTDRRGGLGSFDIFVSHREADGEWGPATNLGPVINTQYEEHTPFISSNDSILFFSSQGHSTIGGIDIYYSEIGNNGEWGEPESLGFPVNTTGEDLFFNPGWDELDGYYAVRREDDPTSNTINMVIELEPEPVVAEAETMELMDPVAEIQVTEDPLMEVRVIEDVPEAEPTDDPVAEPSVMEALEPVETDQIVEVLNKAITPEESPPAQSPPVTGPSVIYTSIPFDHNSYELNMAATLEVEKIADLLLEYPDIDLDLTGHADATGSADYNMLLSLQRADYIAQYLDARGVDPLRITVEGLGESSPLALNVYPDGSDAPLGRYLNRHVYVILKGSLPAGVSLPTPYVPLKLRASAAQGSAAGSPLKFTIQVMADTSPVNMALFEKLGQVEEHICRDDYYRYTFGSYDTFQEAKSKLLEAQKLGYYDSFIQTRDWYLKNNN